MFSFEFLTSKVSQDAPCGPDLDLLGDGDFLQFMASVESDLPDSSKPGSFFDFDRQEKQFPKKIVAMKGLLEQTRDLRLLVALAKMQVLDRQIDPFLTTVRAIDHLIVNFWQDVHPQAEDGDLTLRINSLESLDDFAQVVLPVQHITLFRSRRAGAITYRAFLLSSGSIQPREKDEVKEPVIEPAAFESALFDTQGVEPGQSAQELAEMVASRDQFQALRAAIASIQTNSQELLDFQGSIKFDRLFGLVGDIAGFLERTIARRDPSGASNAAEDGTQEPSGASGAADGVVQGSNTAAPMPAGAVKTLEDVAGALGAVGRYFAKHEPSSPALLLVRQAQGLVGRSFYDALRALLPSHAGEANLLMGAAPGFNMSVERLAEVASEYSEPEQDIDETPVEEPDTGDEAPDEDAPPDMEQPDETDDGEGEVSASDVGDDEDVEARIRPETVTFPVTPAGPKRFEARSRGEALGLMMAVQGYYSLAEPSSPIPLLIDRARGLANSDFSALLKLVMPKQAFRRDDDY